jgi:endonuclease YncB( thermonuclease family)
MAVRKATVGGVLSGFVLAALLVAFFNPPEPDVVSGEFEYVRRVVDGDTLLLGTGERVRLIGVDTPESVRPNTPVQRFGKEAADFTRRMVEASVCGWSMTKQTPLMVIKIIPNRSERWHMFSWKTAPY